mmetsp:Transcript_129510/g.362568  ORF Transcript_129510/g.362568 Transcript_129510/m.362568 type:complete len:243 (-) Transcript_129510:633-1361(-)
MLAMPAWLSTSKASFPFSRLRRFIASSSSGSALISASSFSLESMSGKPPGLEAARFLSCRRCCRCSSSCQRLSSFIRRARSSSCFCSSAFHAAASAARTTTMFSALMAFVSSLPFSRRSSTSHRPESFGFTLTMIPRLPLSWGAFWRPPMRTAWLVRKSAVGVFFCFSAPSEVNKRSTDFLALSSFAYHLPVFWSCNAPTFLATNMCTSTESSLKSTRCPAERSRCAFFQCPSLRWATPLTW